MISTAHARMLAAYNAWMNGRLYDCCGTLTDAARKQDAGAFFKSIHGTLNHLLLADRVWLGRFKGQPYAVKSLDQELYSDFRELRSEREATDAAISDWVGSLDAARLASGLAYTSIASPAPRRYPLWIAVTHFFNHQAHHRGQVTTLLMQRGVDPGVTDLIALPGLQGGPPAP